MTSFFSYGKLKGKDIKIISVYRNINVTGNNNPPRANSVENRILNLPLISFFIFFPLIHLVSNNIKLKYSFLIKKIK